MNRKIKEVLIMLLSCFLSAKIFSTQLDLGNKPLALGSAYTAISGDIYSIYSNPAGLYGGKKFDLKIDLLGSFNLTGDILYNANNILDAAMKYQQIRNLQQNGGSLDIVQIAAFFNGIKNLVEINQPGKGVLLQVNGGIGVKVKNFAFSVRNITNVGLKPLVDDNFLLGSISTSTTPAPFIEKSLFFSGSNSSIIISTDTTSPSDPELLNARDKLKNFIVWLVNELKDLGVDIPDEIENNLNNYTEAIANALINTALANNVSEQEIIEAVDLLSNQEFQNFISSYIDRITNQQVQSFSENSSGLVFRGINYTEFALGYSHKFFDSLLVGANLKYLIGRTLYYHLKIFAEENELNADFIRETINERLEKTYQAVGLDLGAIYKLPVPLPMLEANVGLAIKNLIEPKFELEATDEDIKLPRQFKLGVNGILWKRISLSIDYDLNKTETLVPGYNVQNVALGLEINPPIFPIIRAGYLKNLASNNDDLYTLGLGIKIFLLNIDLVAALYPQQTKIGKDSSIFARNFALGLTLGARF